MMMGCFLTLNWLSMEEKYTFEDWDSGKINIDTESLYYDKTQKPIVVSFSSFSEKDQTKIRQTKEQIFKEKVNEVLKVFISDFTQRFINSEYKSYLLKLEIKQVYSVLNGDFPDTEYVKTSHWEAVFDRDDLIKIQDYAKTYIISGKENKCDFIHSLQSQYAVSKPSKEIPEVYAQTCSDYYKFLMEFRTKFLHRKEESKDKVVDVVVKENEEHKVNEKNEVKEEKEPKNTNLLIFTNEWAFELFTKLCESLLNEDKTKTVLFAFVFFRLREKEVNAIYPKIPRKAYCDFINFLYKEENISITPHQLKNRDVKDERGYEILNSLLTDYSDKLPFSKPKTTLKVV